MFLNFIWYIWICEILFPPQDKKVIVSFFLILHLWLFFSQFRVYIWQFWLYCIFLEKKSELFHGRKKKQNCDM